MIQQTSIESYRSILPDLNSRQQTIYRTIRKLGCCSNNDLSRILKLPINCITPRVKELRDYNLVFRKGVKTDRITNRTVIVWGCA